MKSFVDAKQLKRDKQQAARYAKQVGLDAVTLAVFVPVLEDDALAKLSGTETVNGIVVSTVAIGCEWMCLGVRSSTGDTSKDLLP